MRQNIGLVLIFILFFACSSERSMHHKDLEKEFPEYTKYLLKEKNLPYRQYDLKFEPGLTYQILPAKLVVEAEQCFTFFGPPGAFLFAVNINNRELTDLLPHRYSTEEFRKGAIKYFHFSEPISIYYGYYYPDIDTARPTTVPKNSSLSLYVFNSRASYILTSGKKKSKTEGSTSNQNKRNKVNISDLNSGRMKVKDIARTKTQNTIFWLHIPLHLILLIVLIFVFRRLAYKNIEEPMPSISIHEQWQLDKKHEFLCPHCAKPIDLVGRYRCRVGHIPKQDRLVFKNCEVCTDKIELIKCKKCKRSIPLYEPVYNREEIENRAKEYISRKNPFKFKALVFFWATVSALFYWLILLDLTIFRRPSLIIGNYKDITFLHKMYRYLHGYSLYDPVTGPILIVLLVAAIASTIAYFLMPKKQIVIENPYA